MNYLCLKLPKKQKQLYNITALILANKNSNMRGVIPLSGLGLTSRSLISPSIVYVFPLPVCKQLKIQRRESIPLATSESQIN
jgi:hypothetical protein